MTSRIYFFRIVFALTLLALPAIGACSSSRTSSGGSASERSAEEEEDDDESAAPRPPREQWATPRIDLEVAEGHLDTVTFHIGSPLFLRMRMPEGSACTPFNGQPFFFDASGAQLGWGFQEVVDSLLFPRDERPCDRILMLSSESSNRLAEGYYSLKIQIYNDERSRINSDTILLHPVRSASGATEQSYSRFIQEQIIRNSQLLVNDADTRAALFGEGVPKSAESEIYRALILYRSGDIAGAEYTLKSARDLQRFRERPLAEDARIARDALYTRLTGIPPEH